MSDKNTFFLEINAEKQYFFEIICKIDIKKAYTCFYLILQV